LRRQLKRRQEFSNRCLEPDFNALAQLAATDFELPSAG